MEAWDFFIKLGKQNVMFSQCWDFEDVKFREGEVALMTTYVNRANKMVAEGNYPEYGIIMVPKGPRLTIMFPYAIGSCLTAYLKERLIPLEPYRF